MHCSQLLLLPSFISALSINIDYHNKEQQNPLLPETIPATCKCDGTKRDLTIDGKPYICRDKRLGPRLLPKKFPLLSFVSDYDRFGGQAPGDFLAKWTNSSDGWYIYPPKNGFCLDQAGNPIVGNMTLQVGTKVDRFGSETGK